MARAIAAPTTKMAALGGSPQASCRATRSPRRSRARIGDVGGASSLRQMRPQPSWVTSLFTRDSHRTQDFANAGPALPTMRGAGECPRRAGWSRMTRAGVNAQPLVRCMCLWGPRCYGSADASPPQRTSRYRRASRRGGQPSRYRLLTRIHCNRVRTNPARSWRRAETMSRGD